MRLRCVTTYAITPRSLISLGAGLAPSSTLRGPRKGRGVSADPPGLTEPLRGPAGSSVFGSPFTFGVFDDPVNSVDHTAHENWDSGVSKRPRHATASAAMHIETELQRRSDHTHIHKPVHTHTTQTHAYTHSHITRRITAATSTRVRMRCACASGGNLLSSRKPPPATG
jgi:hypothetical protein